MLLLTGPRASGKTEFCRLLLPRLMPPAISLLSLRSYDGERETGYDLHLSSIPVLPGLGDFSAPLARLSSLVDDHSGGVVGPFSFSQPTFDRAIESVRVFFQSVEGDTEGGKNDGFVPPPAVVLDEVGPVELSFGRGFAPVLPELLRLERCVVVVRPALVAEVRERTLTQNPQAPIRIIDLGRSLPRDERRRLLVEAAHFLSTAAS